MSYGDRLRTLAWEHPAFAVDLLRLATLADLRAGSMRDDVDPTVPERGGA